MSILQKSNSKVSSRRQINIKGVRDGVLILPDHHYRQILSVSSVNFELKSEDEQDALIETYQNFLNSLASPLQIIVRVREMNVDKYLEEISSGIAVEKQEVYKQQMKNYVEFVQSLITTNKILTRKFYIVVPYTATDTNDFSIIKEQLNLNSDLIAKGLGRLGVRAMQLTSLEVLDLFYTFYSPDGARRQPMTDQTIHLLKQSLL
jgi:type IV secretory pathway VirB4 component